MPVNLPQEQIKAYNKTPDHHESIHFDQKYR
jgi:hypothetical protein